MSWTEERVTILKKLWGEGRTAAEIAKELGGVTRNAVIGKAHRLKLSSRVSPIQQNNKKSVKTMETKKVVAKQQAPIRVVTRSKSKVTIDADAIMSGNGYSLADLKEKMCRWPIGDPRDDNFKFCGCRSVPGIPYCKDHAQVAYQAVTRNRILQAEDFEPKVEDDAVEVKEAANG